jgi:hypothetical protein
MAALCRDAATPIAGDVAASGAPERFTFRQAQTSRRRLAMTRQAVGEISMPIMVREFSRGWRTILLLREEKAVLREDVRQSIYASIFFNLVKTSPAFGF